MKPYKTKSILKERIWGGQRLKNFNKAVGNSIIGESWETDLSDQNLQVLIKFIDAAQKLSIQVHPDDTYAKHIEGEYNGKNEMWIILDCQEDSHIVYGFSQKICKETLKWALKENKLQELLNFVKVKKGDCIYIPAGTVHALGAGIIAYEIQQPSDITYRLYDWNRIDNNGNKRELHTEKALEVINFSNDTSDITNIYDAKKDKNNKEVRLINNSFFNSRYVFLEQNDSIKLCGEKAGYVSVMSGSAYLYSKKECFKLEKGDTWKIPFECAEDAYLYGIEHAECIETY